MEVDLAYTAQKEYFFMVDDVTTGQMTEEVSYQHR